VTRKTAIYIGVISIIILTIGYTIIHFEAEYGVKIVKNNTVQYAETIRRSLRYQMLQNKKEGLMQVVEAIGLQEHITEIRIFDKAGKIIISSQDSSVGTFVERNAEGCNSCHLENQELLIQDEPARIYNSKDNERLIGVMQPIYNEKQCFECHPQSEKILGVLDVVVSLKEIDFAIYRNKKLLYLFLLITAMLIASIVVKFTSDLNLINRKLIQANERKSEFIRKVAHQLRAPISAIQSCLKVVTEGYGSKDIHMDMIKRAEHRAEKIIPLVNDLLDLATTEEPLKHKKRENIDLNIMLNRIIALLNKKAEDKNVILSLIIKKTLPHIKACPEDIDDMLMNIIDNSIKYTLPGGEVEVIANTYTKKIFLEIKDTGIGITKEDIPNVFEEFYRAENARKIEKEGTGLGLAISKNIIETYGGSIQIESKVNEGTKFTIYLPV
jgi:signal transduction histidine kinase